MLMKKNSFPCWRGMACMILGIAALGLITACTEKLATDANNPRLAWEEFFGYVSEGDFDSAFDMTGSRIQVSSADLDGKWERSFLGKLAETCSYRFVSGTDVKGVRALQQVEITTLDMRKLVSRSVPVLLEQTEDQIWQHGSYQSDEALTQELRKAMLEQLSQDCTDCLTTQRVKVEFHYRNDRWQPIMNETLYDAISGYAMHADESIETSINAYKSNRRAGDHSEEAG